MEYTLGIVGFGEVGGIFGRNLRGQAGIKGVYAWDVKFADPAAGEESRKGAEEAGIRACASMQELCGQADLLISAVTASRTLDVAEEAARHIRKGAQFLDLNSASPGTKQRAAAAIDGAGGQYVEAGVMTSVPPYGIRVPMLLGGSQAAGLAQTLTGWGMDAKAVSDKLGIASAIKMSRSTMIKGLEALVVEAYTNARAYGVEEHVLPTLQETFPQINWSQQGDYFFSRVVLHGKRRAEEMRESANTVKETGIEPLMASAIAEKQDWMAALAREEKLFEGLTGKSPWQDYADRLIAHAHRKA
ncbi:NAD(P)-dependent oxidoreductase [Xylophilus sp.]|uniref:NAD(P)-dependent oxidoreductase n=1 Tax=Xylophilus sp. TaxID=2653893 RepID=UPI0013B874CA|nr:NAD(P)-dependent oxidoreductase [Xylophilus sp.]KAF1047524.1 MAG: hypothetical protein GAK38_01875 [Xylophilus sp.]